jgi:ABC-type amino acid transport substrate-binding protein
MTSRKVAMARALVLAVTAAVWAAPAAAQMDTLEKIKATGVLVIGTRTGSPPFAFVNRNSEWIGFSLDLVDLLIKPEIEKAVGRPIRIEKKLATPATRIPLLSSNAVDLIAETMTDTAERRQTVDFSLTYFYTGAQFLVKKGSPIHGIGDVGDKRVAVQRGSTNAEILRARYPKGLQLREFPDQPAAFQALLQGQVDAYTNDAILLAGLKAGAPKPDEWEIVGDFYSDEPYGMALHKGDAKLKAVIDAGLTKGFESGQYFELYDKWFGPKSDVPYPMTPQVKAYLLKQIGK